MVGGLKRTEPNLERPKMNNLLRTLLKLNFYKGSPLKYREANYTLHELEKRLTAEINRLG